MSDYNWCHNPRCHTIHTQSRSRASGDNKVLRTMKIKANRYGDYQANIWNYFCNQRCLMMFLNKFGVEIANTYSVKQPSETPIKVIKEKYDTHRYRYTDNGYERYETVGTKTQIEEKMNK